MNYIHRTWAEINLNALDYNVSQVRSKMKKGHKIMGIVKADAYGNGDGYIARRLQELDFNWFGVSNVEEAVSLRKEGIVKPILILGYTPIEATEYLVDYDITQAVIDINFAKSLQEEAQKLNAVIDCHIAIDSGMTRVGFQIDKDNFEQSLNEIIEVSKLPNLHITGVFTHYSVADSYSSDNPNFTEMQFNNFCQIVDAMKAAGIDTGVCHCANSATTISYPDKHKDMCRAGVILYGMYPSKECKGRIDVKPIMTIKTSICMIKNVKAGAQLSYGRTFTVEKDSVIATVPIGYADGYNRLLSNKGKMILKGHYVPVVGRVCMDQLMLDVTDVPDVKMGDEVIVVGQDGDKSVTFDDLAEIAGTINYEMSVLITKRVPRIYIDNGKIVGTVNILMKRYR